MSSKKYIYKSLTLERGGEGEGYIYLVVVLDAKVRSLLEYSFWWRFLKDKRELGLKQMQNDSGF